jgi:hypothetical protein
VNRSTRSANPITLHEYRVDENECRTTLQDQLPGGMPHECRPTRSSCEMMNVASCPMSDSSAARYSARKHQPRGRVIMKGFLWAMALVAVVGCLDTGVSTTSDPKVSTAEQADSTCSSTCDPPTYNGVPVSCTTSDTCISDANGVDCRYTNYWIHISCQPYVPCGNGVCDPGETPENCPADCNWCGNGVCNGNETYQSCPSDCPCGDGFCADDEHTSCPTDCWWWCPTCSDQ